MSQEQNEIVIEGKGVRAQHFGTNSEGTIIFHNFLRVSQVLLASIVAPLVFCKFTQKLDIRDVAASHPLYIYTGKLFSSAIA